MPCRFLPFLPFLPFLAFLAFLAYSSLDLRASDRQNTRLF
jgi:hypothetical protein